MTPIQQMFLGAGGAAKKTYMDDLFSTYLWAGSASSRSINNGIDLSTEGGLVWTKRRDNTGKNMLFDTTRGVSKNIRSDVSDAEVTETNTLTTFNSNGFSLGTDDLINGTSRTYAGWTFRKAPGFFDVVTYTGSGSAKTVAHSLGSVPGMVMVKNLSNSQSWAVYHRKLNGGTSPEEWYLMLNSDADNSIATSRWNDTAPTSSVFTVGDATNTNSNGDNYVAYVFAGGESTAATARSVDFDGSDDALLIGGSSGHNDLYGPGDFTLEAWIKPHDWSGGTYQKIYENSATGGMMLGSSNNDFGFYTYGTSGNNPRIVLSVSDIQENQWSHIAVTRSGTTIKLFVNGVEKGSVTSSYSFLASGQTTIGTDIWDSDFNGEISNLRYVKGTAVYTSSFKPPTEPLTNITNTKLLCCNNSSTTGSTVTPATITTAGNPTASTDSPFDDPAGFVFGDAEDQNVIKCGSYVGNGSATGPEIHLGWEPQWILLKRTSGSGDWVLLDSMRGIVTDPSGDDARLYANTTHAEENMDYQYLDLTPTGFKLKTTATFLNSDGETYIYITARRPDGYVGKPAELGTDVFAMDTGTGSSTIPNFDSGFPVDFAFYKRPADTSDWWVNARLMQGKELVPNSTAAESAYAGSVFDSNTGWNTGQASTAQAWMWKRHAGFDVVAYAGNGTAGRQIPHNLSKTPEMIWVKSRSNTFHWVVGHKGLDGGTNPWEKNLYLNDSSSETDYTFWNDSAPSATQFTVGNDDYVNGSSSKTYIAMLFASVDGISKVGYYDGSSSAQTITTGFQPRFLIVKCMSHSGNWITIDTTNGWTGSNSDKFLMLNSTSANNTYQYATPTSTGFTVIQDNTNLEVNGSGRKWIYYAHA